MPLARALALLLLVCAGCSRAETAPPASAPGARACTEIGCGPGIIVRFDRRRPWSYGEYRVEVETGDQSVTCTTKLPLLCDAPPACTDPSVTLEEIGCALAIGEQALGGVALAHVPDTLTVRVFEGDTLLAEDTWTPEARTTRPNGPQCEPECVQARDVTIVLPPAG